MILLEFVPFLVAVLLAVRGERLGQHLPPATAVRLITVLALTSAAGMGFVLAVTAFSVLAQLPAAARAGHWSAQALHRNDPLPVSAGLLLTVAVVLPLASALLRAGRQLRDLTTSELACRRLGPSPTGLVIVPDDRPDAYTLPGLTGRVVVSTGMLRALPAPERRVLLAHEDSHLRHRHHLYIELSDLAAASNPLLRPAARAVRLAAERWADEDAATEAGDRLTVARALARAALAQAGNGSRRTTIGTSRGVLRAVGSAVRARVDALLAPSPARRLPSTLAVCALIAITLSAIAATEKVTEHRFEHAQRVFTQQYRAG